MQDKLHLTMENINRWRHFRLRLLTEGILIGVGAGLVISSFRWALQLAEKYRNALLTSLATASAAEIWLPLSAWIALLALVGLIISRLVKIEPLASGSGIPQVKGALLGLVKMRWLSILCSKLLGGVCGIGAGLSLGREGPSIQLGAVAAQGISRALGRTRMEERYLLTSGASAGLAAAFNAPLAGVIFALEELHKNFSVVVLVPSMTAAITATVISRTLFGREAIFVFGALPLVPIDKHYFLIIITAVAAGLVGVLFNKGLLNISRFYALPCFPKAWSKLAFALALTYVLGLILPEVLGGGNELINNLAQAPVPLRLLSIFFVTKFLFTLLAYGSGAPGGFFLPMLVIGALCGSLCAQLFIAAGWLNAAFAGNLVIVSMAALFAACTRAPITAMVLIMEMTASYQHLLVLALSAITAFAVAEFCHSKPIYEELLQQSLAGSQPGRKLLQQRNVTEICIASGSILENKLIKDISWPQNTLLVDIKRGEVQLIPHGNTRLSAGDFIYIMTENANVQLLLQMAEESKAEKQD